MYKCVIVQALQFNRVDIQNNAYIFQKNAKNMNNSYATQVKVATKSFQDVYFMRAFARVWSPYSSFHSPNIKHTQTKLYDGESQ